MTNAELVEPTSPDRQRFRFSLRHLLLLVTLGCLLAGLCLWRIWDFEERMLLLTWGISLVVAEVVARRTTRSIWWPAAGSVLAIAVAYFVLRSLDDRSGGRIWSENLAWHVWRPWAILLVAAALASIVSVASARAAPGIPPAARWMADRLRKSPRIRWLAFAMTALVTIAAGWRVFSPSWSPDRVILCRDRPTHLMFNSDGNQFVLVGENGQVAIWDWDSSGPLAVHQIKTPNSDESPRFHFAMLAGNRLASASSLGDTVAVNRLSDWKIERTFAIGGSANEHIEELHAFKDGERLLIVHGSADDHLLHFAFRDEVKQVFLEHHSYDDTSVAVAGLSSSGRYGGVVDRVNFDRWSFAIIDFQTQSVILEKRRQGYGWGPVVFFDEDRRFAHIDRVYSLDGKEDGELPGVAVGVVPNTRRLLLLEFQSLFPEWFDELLREVPIVGHIPYVGRVRLIVMDPDKTEPVAKSAWFYGNETGVTAALSPDGRRVVWLDNQGRLLLWTLPVANSGGT